MKQGKIVNFIRVVTVILLFGISPVSANQREPAPPPQDPSVATIRGDIESGTFGSTSSRVMYIDGRFLPGQLETCDRHDLAPGPHSLVVAYKGRWMPLRLDAAPGDAFIVKWERDDTVYVTNEKTGQTVFRKHIDDANHDDRHESLIGQITGSRTPAVTYAEPSGADTALVNARPEVVKAFPFGETNDGRVEISAIDGETLSQSTHSARLASGPRAIAFYLSFYVAMGTNYQPIFGWTKIPVMLDAKPGAVYRLRFEKPGVGLGPRHISIWVEDEATGETVIPRTVALVNIGTQFGGFAYREAVSFPEGKGQLKRPPPKPKQWCERER